METIRDYYAAALTHKQQILVDLIELIVLEKKLMSMDDNYDDFIQRFLNPPPHLKDKWNRFYIQEIAKMKEKKERMRTA